MILWLRNNKGALILYAIIIVFTLMMVNNNTNTNKLNTNISKENELVINIK